MVASAFGNVDFSRTGPLAVCIIVRHHPDGGPQPVSLGHLCHDLDLAEGNGLFAFCGDTGAADGIDDGTGRLVGADRTIVDAFGGAGSIGLAHYMSVPLTAHEGL